MLTALVLPVIARARDFTYTYEGQELTYTVISEEEKTCMTKEGTKTYSYTFPGNKVTGDVVIPSIASDGSNEYTVTKIGRYGFSKCNRLTSVTIPNSVTSIGEDAFIDCYDVKKCAYPNTLEISHLWYEIKRIPYPAEESVLEDGFIYNKDKTKLYFVPLNLSGNFEIPNTVKSIEYAAFYSCETLKSVIIPNSVISIGSYAFDSCAGLTSVTIPNSVTSIGYNSFSGCKGLKSVIIPNSVISIGSDAFRDVKKLAYPSTISNPFTPSYSEYQGIKYPAEGSVIEDGFIYNTDKTELYFVPLELSGSFEIPKTVTNIGKSAFLGCAALTSVTFPNSVSTIEDYAFRDCKGLTSVTLPNSLSSLGGLVFDNCPLEELLIPRTIRYADINFLISYNTDISVTSMSMTFKSEPYLKIIDEKGNEVPLKEAADIKNSYEYEWDQNTVTFKNLHPNQYLSFRVLGIYVDGRTRNIDISIKTIKEYADLAVVEASFDYEEFVTDYYWNYKNGNNVHKKRLSIPYGTVAPVQFSIEGQGFSNYWDLGEINYPKPVFTECEAVATSLNKARLTAKCNLSTGASATIEWRRNNAPDNVKSNTVTCPVVNGVLMGELRGLKDDVYYKFRPVYERDGVKYYGEWVGIFTGDAGVYFAPEVGTLASVVADNKAELEGYVYPGTDDVSESGIEYRVTDTSVNTDRPQRAAGEWIRVPASSSTFFKVLLENLTYDSEYEYRTFAVAGDNTYYGETAKFRTESSSAGIDEILADNDGRLKVLLHSVPKGGNPKVIVNGNGEAIDCHIHTITGLRIKSCQVVADGTPQEVEANLTPGIYVLTVAGTRGTDSIRMIIR